MNAAAPLVSVIIPCFNARPMLRSAVWSVIDQSYSNIEIIFVDNNSTDRSVDVASQIARACARSMRITKCAAQGANNARNWGHGFARGEFIQWMDADDRLDRDKIALQVAALERIPDDDIAYGDWTARHIEAGKPRSERRKSLQQVSDQVHRVLAGIWYPPHLYLLRRRAAQRLQDVQAWWPERKVATDVEYCAIAALLGLRFRHVPGAHVHYNIWSSRQISGGTSYTDRVAALEAIFRRLREFARSDQAGVALTRQHQVLLNQDRHMWTMPRGSACLVQLPDNRFRLRHARTGKEIELGPREVTIAKTVAALSRPLASWHFALLLAELMPAVGGDPAAVVLTLQRFQREGFCGRWTRSQRNERGRASGTRIGGTAFYYRRRPNSSITQWPG